MEATRCEDVWESVEIAPQILNDKALSVIGFNLQSHYLGKKSPLPQLSIW
jgi:hypothetical protein